MAFSAQHDTRHQDTGTSNDYHRVPATEKQIRFARSIAQRANIMLPWDVQEDRQTLSTWIDEHQGEVSNSPFANYPSSKQVAFAERIGRIKRRTVPRECFRDRKLMSLWIDGNR